MAMGLAKRGGRFINANRAICDRIEGLLPEPFNRNLLSVHSLAVVAEIGKRSPAATVLDIGGGRDSPFAKRLPKGPRPTFIGLDIATSEISANDAIDFGVVGDACEGLPLKDASIDIAVT